MDEVYRNTLRYYWGVSNYDSTKSKIIFGYLKMYV